MAEKPPLTHEEQLKQLYKRNLSGIPKNYNFDLAILKQCNYYTLINSFGKPFLADTRTNQYHTGTSLFQIHTLYQFDGALRKLYLTQLLYIEAFLKNIIGYQVAHYFKNHAHDSYKDTFFCDPKNYPNPTDKETKEVIKEFQTIIKNSRTKIPYITHYLDPKNHGYVPIWILVNELTFGKLSKFYQILPQDLKENIVVLLGQPKNTKHLNKDIKKLEKDLWAFSTLRNHCAHNQRIYGERFAKNTRSLQSIFDAMQKISKKSPYLQSSFEKLEKAQKNETKKLDKAFTKTALPAIVYDEIKKHLVVSQPKPFPLTKRALYFMVKGLYAKIAQR